MINLNENPNLEVSSSLDEYKRKELEKTEKYLPDDISISCNIKLDNNIKMNFLTFPYENENERISWTDILTKQSTTNYANRGFDTKNGKTLGIRFNRLKNHIKYLDLYFMSDMLIENFVMKFFLLDITNTPEILFSYKKDFYESGFGVNLGTFAKIENKWRFYPKFKIEIFEYDRLINNRMQGDKL